MREIKNDPGVSGSMGDGKWPAPFLDRMKGMLGKDFDSFLNALAQPAPTSIRLNPQKPLHLTDCCTPLPVQGEVPWCDQGFYLESRPVFTLDPLFHGGAYYVQEASSMFLQAVVRQVTEAGKPLRVLDLCAAPGGKSTLLAANLPPGSLLVANEVIKSRATILKENIIKWGCDHVVVTSADPSRFGTLPGVFDLLVADVPCSGEGLFRRDPGAVSEWSPDHLRLCEERQKRILSDSLECLAPGGILVYSTCTYNPGENEKMVSWLMEKYGMEPLPVQHTIEGICQGDAGYPCYRFYPHRLTGEGLFMAVLRKGEEGVVSVPKEKRSSTPRMSVASSTLNTYLKSTDGFVLYQAGSMTGVLPGRHEAFIQLLEKKAGVLYKGCELGELLKGKLKPAHSLALYPGLDPGQVEVREVDTDTALSYLRKEEIRFDASRGAWILLTYHTIPIGWVKEAGNRLNNYYPKEWRIKNL